MYLLDTDTVSNAIDKRRTFVSLQRRIASEPPEKLHISVITLSEIAHGWLDIINQARKHPRNGAKIVQFYALFQDEMQSVIKFNILPYDEEAEKSFQTIPASVRQQHSQDCHIAAIALSRGLIVVTANISHFSKIAGLRCEDWTLEPRDEIG